MPKRGQATIIIFLALILVIIIALVFYIKSKVYIGGADIQDLRRELDPVIRHVEKCLYDAAEEAAVLAGKQGGYIAPQEDTYRLYEGNKISYLCYNRPEVPQCSNRYLRLRDIEDQLKQYINQKLNTCLKVSSFEKAGYTIILGNRNLKVDIGFDNIISTLTYPVKIKKDDKQAEIETFSKAVPLPLGRLFSAASDIVNSEAVIGYFNTVFYSMVKSKFTDKPYIIQKLQPYPDKLYILKLKDIPSEKEPYIFQFFIQGEAR